MSADKREDKIRHETVLEVPGNKAPIDTLWAWLSKDTEGKEGVMANGHLPLISGDKALMERFLPKITEIKKDKRAEGYTFSLVEFKRVTNET